MASHCLTFECDRQHRVRRRFRVVLQNKTNGIYYRPYNLDNALSTSPSLTEKREREKREGGQRERVAETERKKERERERERDNEVQCKYKVAVVKLTSQYRPTLQRQLTN